MTTPDSIDQGFEVEPYKPPFLGARGRPAGYLALPDQPAQHRCTPPVLRDASESAAGDVGAVWRCPCDTLWTVYRLAPADRGQRVADPFDRRWRRAGWLLRWRYRNADHADPADAWPRTTPDRLPRGGSGVSS